MLRSLEVVRDFIRCRLIEKLKAESHSDRVSSLRVSNRVTRIKTKGTMEVVVQIIHPKLLQSRRLISLNKLMLKLGRTYNSQLIVTRRQVWSPKVHQPTLRQQSWKRAYSAAKSAKANRVKLLFHNFWTSLMAAYALSVPLIGTLDASKRKRRKHKDILSWHKQNWDHGNRIKKCKHRLLSLQRQDKLPV